MAKPLPPKIWQPIYRLTARQASNLMLIEAARTAIAHLRLSPKMEAKLRHEARIRSTHHSTRIEGNRLTLAEANQVITGKKLAFHGRERDVHEVKNYWEALVQVEAWAMEKKPLTESLIRKLHAMVEKGKRARLTPYRDGQNVIRDGASGGIVYLPPEAPDVPRLMDQMIAWVKSSIGDRLPVPLIAGLLHYQFVTIHPFFDGNGRTARLLATFILQRESYGLNGFFSLEEHHARDLEGYYQSLAVHPHHNYYEGYETADLTPWVEYFIQTLADVFQAAEKEVRQNATAEPNGYQDFLKKLDRRAKLVFGLFLEQETISSADAATLLKITDRTARTLLLQWVEAGWLVKTGSGNRDRRYQLSEIYRKFIGN